MLKFVKPLSKWSNSFQQEKIQIFIVTVMQRLFCHNCYALYAITMYNTNLQETQFHHQDPQEHQIT